jgi:four helix bundle protein
MKNTPSTPSIVAPAAESAPLLDAERLDVYAVALQFHGLAAVLASRADSIVRDQLRRASLSCVLNIAEGAGQRSRPQKRRFYSIARGSAMECAALLDVLSSRALASHAEARQGRSWLVRMVQMLTRLDQSLRCEVGGR